MAATEAICFAVPAQLSASSFGRAGTYFSPHLHPLWRYSCLLPAARLALQRREPRR